MAKSVHRATWDWLQGCKYAQNLFFNFGEMSSAGTIMIPNDRLEQEYASGAQRRAYDVELAVFLPLTTDAGDDGNIAMLERIDAIADWIRGCWESGNTPEFPEGKNIDEIVVNDSVAGYAVAQNGVIAKYSLSFTIYYMKKEW